MSAAERSRARGMEKLPFNETRYRKELGARACRGEGLLDAGTRVGAAHLRGERLLSGFTGEGARPCSRRSRWPSQHAPGARPGSNKVAASSSVREEDLPGDGGDQGHPHAGGKRGCRFDKVRPCGGRAIEQGLASGRCSTAKADRSRSSRRSRREGVPSVLFRLGCRTRTRTRPTRSSIRELPQRNHPSAYPTEIANIIERPAGSRTEQTMRIQKFLIVRPCQFRTLRGRRAVPRPRRRAAGQIGSTDLIELEQGWNEASIARMCLIENIWPTSSLQLTTMASRRQGKELALAAEFIAGGISRSGRVHREDTATRLWCGFRYPGRHCAGAAVAMTLAIPTSG